MKKIYNEGEKFATKLQTDTICKKKDTAASTKQTTAAAVTPEKIEEVDVKELLKEENWLSKLTEQALQEEK